MFNNFFWLERIPLEGKRLFVILISIVINNFDENTCGSLVPFPKSSILILKLTTKSFFLKLDPTFRLFLPILK